MYCKILHTPVGLIILLGSIEQKDLKLKRVLGVNFSSKITLSNFVNELNRLGFAVPEDLCKMLNNCYSDKELEVIVKDCFKNNGIQFDDSIIELESIAKKIENYFISKLGISIDFTILELDSLTDFQKMVLKTLTKVSFGETVSYSQLAKMSSHPKAQRAVGSVMSKNPFPLLIPCHRVIRSDGKIGNFALGTEMKIKLLKHEDVNYK